MRNASPKNIVNKINIRQHLKKLETKPRLVPREEDVFQCHLESVLQSLGKMVTFWSLQRPEWSCKLDHSDYPSF